MRQTQSLYLQLFSHDKDIVDNPRGAMSLKNDNTTRATNF